MMLLVALVGAVASAQDPTVPVPPSLGADPLRVDLFADHTAMVPTAAGFEGFRATAAVVHVRDPFVFYPAESDEPVAIIGPVWGLYAGLARTFGPVAVGMSLPVFATVGSDLTDGKPASALGDLALDARFIGIDAKNGLGVSGQARFTAPMGGDALYIGQPGFTWELLAVGEARLSDTSLVLALGTRGVPAVELDGAELNDLLLYRLGVGQDLGPGGASVELLGQRQYQGFLDDPTNSPLELLLSGWADLHHGRRVRGALGWGINAGIGSPQLRVVLGIGADDPGLSTLPPPDTQ